MSLEHKKRVLLWIKEQNLRGLEFGQEISLAQLKQRHRGSTEAHRFLDSLKSTGIDSQHVLEVIKGNQRPHIDVFGLHCEWVLAARIYCENQERKNRIAVLAREFRKMKGIEDRLLNSSLFSSSFKNACKEEFDVISSALADLIEGYDSKPCLPFTVSLFDPKQRRKGNEWSRQTFWTDIILSLHSIWVESGKTDYYAFKDISRLFALFFPPFPDNPGLIKRRYYNARSNRRSS